MAEQGRELSIPFRIDPNGGIATTRSRDEVLVNHVVSVIGTQPTERVMRPEYGCDIQRFAFSLGDPNTLADMDDVVRSSMERYCPEARFISLSAEPPNENGMFVVSIRFAVANDPRDNPLEAVLEFAVQSEGGDLTEMSNDG